MLTNHQHQQQTLSLNSKPGLVEDHLSLGSILHGCCRTAFQSPVHLLAGLLCKCGTTYMHSHVFALDTCRKNTKHYSTVTNMLKVQVKVKFTLDQAMKAQMGSRGMAVLFP
jgi:hypothetical protein